MKVRGQHLLPLPPDASWALLLNTEALARAIPGCEKLVPLGPDEYEMKMKIAVAGIQGLFAGKVRITDQKPPESYQLHIEGQGKLGFIRGSGLLTLVPASAESTAVHYEGEVQITGILASVGERLLDATTKMMVGRFFNNLAKQASAP